MEAEQAEIAEHDTEQQFAEHGGKADLLGERREEAGGEQDDGQPQQVLADHVRAGREHRPGGGEQGEREEAAEGGGHRLNSGLSGRRCPRAAMR